MGKPKKTPEQFESEVKALVGDEYLVCAPYETSSSPIIFFHTTCGRDVKLSPNDFLSKGRRCKYCKISKRRKTNEKFLQEVRDAVGDEYIPLDDYTNSRTHLRMKHNVEGCGHVYPVTPNNFQRGNRCPMCNGNEAKRKSTEMFKKEVENLVGDEYTVIGEYLTNDTPLDIRHNTCNRVYPVQPNNFINGSRCIECYYDSLRLSKEEVEKEILEHLGDGYHLSGEYVSLQKLTVLHHDMCDKDFPVRISDVIQKHSGCPNCAQSRGESYVATFLSNKGESYEPQKKFDDLKSINHLSYDFYVPSQKVLIEYQGEQHYKPKNFGGISMEKAQKNFELQVVRDNLKRAYAKEHGFTLIEIPYKMNTLSKVSSFLTNNFSYWK